MNPVFGAPVRTETRKRVRCRRRSDGHTVATKRKTYGGLSRGKELMAVIMDAGSIRESGTVYVTGGLTGTSETRTGCSRGDVCRQSH